MKNKQTTYIKGTVLPCLGLSLAAGVLTGVVIFLFKLATTAVIHFSEAIYATVRQSPVYLPLLCIGAVLVGLTVSFILHWEPSCRGGGIPTAIALLRGFITFRWLRSLIAVFFSSMLTYLGGVPLGTEGPSVQMGGLLGRGTVHLLARDNPAWDRYIMTGGACAGFACATGAPLTGILFAFEEAHRRFSPMIFMTAASAVIAGCAISDQLCSMAEIHFQLFSLGGRIPSLPLRYLWVTLAVGIVCGIIASALAQLYRFVKANNHRIRIPRPIRISIVFLLTALAGFASANLIGTGHSLIDLLLHGRGVWYLSILYLAVRSTLLIVATNKGITGGLFIPSLAFGALIGSICGDALISLGLLPSEYYMLTVTVGMAAFLASFSRTPLMAIAFAFEVLGGISNLIPIVLAVTFAYIIIETVGISSFVESIVEDKAKAANKGKHTTVIDEHLTVAPRAFVVGKEIRDVLWPPSCTVVSVSKNPVFEHHGDTAIHPGDVLHLRYLTCDPEESRRILWAIIGAQAEQPNSLERTAKDHYEIPHI